MHGIGHTIAQVFGKFIACTIFYCKYPGIKLQNWDAATCRTLVYIHLFGFFFFLYRPLGRNLDTQDRPLWFLSLFSFGPSMASEAISEHLIFVGGMPYIMRICTTVKRELSFQQYQRVNLQQHKFEYGSRYKYLHSPTCSDR